MGAIIQSTGVSLNGSVSSLELSVQAGNACIKNAGLEANDIDVLISVGIYHDDNIVEPAMAPLIQKSLGINPDPIHDGTMKFTFCFDLYNGACGFINALQVADSLLTTGQAKHILIVSADTHPSKTVRSDFPFKPVGAALLMGRESDRDKGFKDFYINTSTNGYSGLIGGADMMDWQKNGIKGRAHIVIREEEGFMKALHDFSIQSAENYLKTCNIDLHNINFLITSQQEKDFTKRMYDGIGLNGIKRSVNIFKQYGDPHTSSLPLGLHEIIVNGELKENDTVMMVAAGSGLTAAFATYTA